MKRCLQILLMVSCLISIPAWAKMQAKPVEWMIGNDHFSGMLVYDDAGKAKRPGLVMVPDWWGVTDANIEQAKRIAGTRYVILVADMYGKGVRPKDKGEANAQVSKLYGGGALMRERAAKAVDVLKAQAGKAPLDASRIAAFGYCFGGSSVLELARGGARLAGVISFHGGLKAVGGAASPGDVHAPVLVLNGADDSYTAGDVAAFQKEMKAAGADLQFVDFSGAVHCFALPAANDPPGCMYNKRAADRAYRMMQGFLDERFGVAAR